MNKTYDKRLRGGKIKTKNQSSQAFKISKNKILKPIIAAGNTEVINIFRMNINWSITQKTHQIKLHKWQLASDPCRYCAILCSVLRVVLSVKCLWNNVHTGLIPPLIVNTSEVNGPCSLFKTQSFNLRFFSFSCFYRLFQLV